MSPPESRNNNEPMRRRTSYGLTATVVIGPGFLHRAGFGRLLIPHPPLVNWLLRRGVGEADGRALAFIHEFGHLQTLPLAVLYLGANLACAAAPGNLGWRAVPFLLLSAHAAWEMMAEGYVVVSNRPLFRRSYAGKSYLARMVFWTSLSAVSLSGWVVALYNN